MLRALVGSTEDSEGEIVGLFYAAIDGKDAINYLVFV